MKAFVIFATKILKIYTLVSNVHSFIDVTICYSQNKKTTSDLQPENPMIKNERPQHVYKTI